MNEQANARPPRRGAFFTLSFLFDRQQIDELLRACWPLGARMQWDKDLLKDLQKEYEHSNKLHDAINPMFEDIADRARNLFLRDFLLDTPSLPFRVDDDGHPLDEAAAVRRNVCADVTLQLAHRVEWQTEGRNTESIALRAPIRFDGVLFRAFWMAHSNEALSYHLSLEVPYRASIEHCLGLSMLQKVFFNTEGTKWLLEDGGAKGWQASAQDQERIPLLGLVEQLFEEHVEHLLNGIEAARRRADGGGPARVKVRAWQRLVLRRRDAFSARSGTDPERWALAARHRRLLIVLRDAAVFDTLKNARMDGSALLSYKPIDPTLVLAKRHDAYDIVALLQAIREQVVASAEGTKGTEGATPRLRPRQRDSLTGRYALALFLSGFLQNIIDFLQQDGLEVHDALMPEYPPAGESGANQGFMIYATPSVMYEVVSSSRSLEGAGRQWIGTCPYIFLVHMTAFHNESLVLAYENNVSKLVGHLQGAGLSADRSAAGEGFEAVLDHAYECIRDFRLVTFEQVHKHYSFNVFRYDTEKQFFNAIEDVRGVVPRRAYWDDVLKHLTETVDGLKQNREAHFQRSVAGFGLLLTGIGLLQTWLALFPLGTEQQMSAPTWGHGLAALALIVGLGIVYRRFVWRRGGAGGQAWRSHGDDEPPAQPGTAARVTPSR